MKVSDLIEHLKELPPDADVGVPVKYRGGCGSYKEYLYEPLPLYIETKNEVIIYDGDFVRKLY